MRALTGPVSMTLGEWQKP